MMMTTERYSFKYLFYFLSLLAVLYFLARYVVPMIWSLM